MRLERGGSQDATFLFGVEDTVRAIQDEEPARIFDPISAHPHQ